MHKNHIKVSSVDLSNGIFTNLIDWFLVYADYNIYFIYNNLVPYKGYTQTFHITHKFDNNQFIIIKIIMKF